MGFFARLKWLFTGSGEAPANFNKSASQGKPDSFQRGRSPGYGNRDRGGRDRNQPRNDRGQRGGGRHDRDSSRDRNQQQGERGGRGRRHDRYSDRDRGPYSHRSRPQGGGYGRHDSGSGGGSYERIERPAGGPSSTMRPAQSSASEMPTSTPERIEQQGPEKVGIVTHYFDQAKVAAVKIEKGSMRDGDWIEIQGNVSSLRQKVDSMQVDNVPVPEAHEGQEVGIRVIRPVKSGDAVVRLRG